MNKVALLLLSSFVLLAMASHGAEPTVRRLNVVLVLTDDQGWGDMGYRGHPVLRTPHLDQLAQSGVRLDRFYAAAPVCSPTRGSVLTGRHPSRYGINWAQEGRLPQEEITLAEVLQEAGYRTGHFGKWHLGQLSRTLSQGSRDSTKEPDPRRYAPPWEHGFSVCFSTSGRVPTHNPYSYADETGGRFANSVIPSYADAPVRELYRWPENYWTGPGCFVDEPLQGDDSALIMDRVLEFIDADQEPFFACVWFHTPHTPVVAGAEWRARHAERSIEEQHWYGSLEAMDHQIGRLVEALTERGLDDTTLIWFGSDNGPSYTHPFGSVGPYSGRKGDLLEGGIRVPGIVWGPEVLKGGRRVDAPIFTSDIFPTVLALTGTAFAHPLPLDGADVSALLSGQAEDREDPLFFHSPRKAENIPWADPNRFQAAIQSGPFKLLTLDSGTSWRLHDLRVDPAEANNIAEAHPDWVASMVLRYTLWRSSCEHSAAGGDYESLAN